MDRSPTTERRPARAALAVLALFAVITFGCAPRTAERPTKIRPKDMSLVPREGAGPIWEWDEATEGRTSFRVLHPFIGGESRPGRRVFVFRPFFSHEDEGPGSTRWKFRALWPLFLVERNDDSHRVRIFPFVWERNRSKVDGSVHDKDFQILPFIWYGNDTEEGKHFALWPVGGMIKGAFGKKYIRFVLWPLWVEAQDKNYHSWNYPWPILGHWRGPDQRGFRIWPFYGINQRDGKFKRIFYLWPLGHYWKTGLDTDAPGTFAAFMPLYAKFENKNVRHVSVLWPFFSRKHNRLKEYVEWHAPWPFYSRTVGKGLRGLKIWPFYEHRFAPNINTRSFGWIAWKRTEKYSDEQRRTKTNSFLIFQSLRDEWVEIERNGKTVKVAPPRPDRNKWLEAEREGHPTETAGRKDKPEPAGVRKSRVNTLLWPLFRYQRNEHGERFFTILEPWFWRNREIWDRHYGPFVTLYRYESFADGSKREKALFNLYEHYRSPTERRVRFSPITDYWRRGNPAEYKRFRILGGLFGYERRGRMKRVRFLWIPIGRRPEGWK